MSFIQGPKTLSPPPSVCIYVRKGGTLIIDGGTLTRCNDHDWFWKGIHFGSTYNLQQTTANQGTLIMKNGGTIEYAWEGIEAEFGGIVKAKNANFTNVGRFAAEFLLHEYFGPTGNKLPSVSYFINCTFKADQNYPVRYGDAVCESLGRRKLQTTFISIWRQDDILFSGCKFLNESGLTLYWHQCGNGIDVTNADVRVLAMNPDVAMYPAGCNIGTGNGNEFYGLARGIKFVSGNALEEHYLKVSGTLDADNPEDITKRPNKFINCKIGVYAEQAFKPFLFGNVFQIDDDFPNIMDYTGACATEAYPNNITDPYVSNIYLNGQSMDYRIINNYFEYDRILHDEEIGMVIINDPRFTSSATGWTGQLTESNRFLGSSPSCTGTGGMTHPGRGIWLLDYSFPSRFLCNKFELDNMSVASCGTIHDILVDYENISGAQLIDQYHFDASLNKFDAANTWSTMNSSSHFNIDNKRTYTFKYHHSTANTPSIPAVVNINLIPSPAFDCNLNFNGCGDGTWNDWGGPLPPDDPIFPMKRSTNPYKCINDQFELMQAMDIAIGRGDYELYRTTIPKFDMTCTVENYLRDLMEYWLIFEDQVKEGRNEFLFTKEEIAKLEAIAANKQHHASFRASVKLRLAKEWEGRINMSTNSDQSVVGAKSLLLYPNPAQNTLTIQTDVHFENTKVSVYNVLGQRVLHEPLKQNVINIEALSSGSYLLRIDSKTDVYVQKFMVKK